MKPDHADLEIDGYQGNVIFLGSFSKIFMPGLRIGWMVAHHDILEKAVMTETDR